MPSFKPKIYVEIFFSWPCKKSCCKYNFEAFFMGPGHQSFFGKSNSRYTLDTSSISFSSLTFSKKSRTRGSHSPLRPSHFWVWLSKKTLVPRTHKNRLKIIFATTFFAWSRKKNLYINFRLKTWHGQEKAWSATILFLAFFSIYRRLVHLLVFKVTLWLDKSYTSLFRLDKRCTNLFWKNTPWPWGVTKFIFRFWAFYKKKCSRDHKYVSQIKIYKGDKRDKYYLNSSCFPQYRYTSSGQSNSCV